MKYITSLFTFLVLGFVGQVSASDIQAPLTDAHWQLIFKNAPIIVQPSCDPQSQLPCRYDYDGDWDPTNNDANSAKLTKSSPAALDIDVDETGAILRIIYQFNRNQSKDHGFSGQPLLVYLKKDHIGSTFADGVDKFKFEAPIFVTNAYSAPLYSTASEKTLSVLPYDYSFSAGMFSKNLDYGLTSFTLNAMALKQVQGGAEHKRLADLDQSRPVLLSDAYGNLGVASNLKDLIENVDSSTTMIFVPKMGDETIDMKALEAQWPQVAKAKGIVTYDLKREFVKSVLDGKETDVRNFMSTKAYQTQVVKFKALGGGEVVTLGGIGSEPRYNAKGDASGANPWFGWSQTAVRSAGNLARLSPEPTHHKNNAERIDLYKLPEITSRCFHDLVTADEIKAGGIEMVRSPLMKDSK
ncbi:MAG: hypothetical protein J0L93_07520 [Deltaproteobacteria bacterium]|nr:hypothetical protein [Deltaproteobacteria bacterium]